MKATRYPNSYVKKVWTAKLFIPITFASDDCTSQKASEPCQKYKPATFLIYFLYNLNRNGKVNPQKKAKTKTKKGKELNPKTGRGKDED